MQEISWFDNGEVRSKRLPSPATKIVDNVVWGYPDQVLSPAFWALHAADNNSPLHGYIAPHAKLVDEVAFCLLGGFGIKVEVAEVYHVVLRNAGAYDCPYLTEAALRELLLRPVEVEGRLIRYRFPNQRAARVSHILPQLDQARFKTSDPIELRHQLLSLHGIGAKTASWIVRNCLGADSVAILDIHVIRACQFMGLFPSNINLSAQYFDLEAKFIKFAEELGVRPSVLDAVIWHKMREFSPTLIRTLT